MFNWESKDWLAALGIGAVGVLIGVVVSRINRSKPLSNIEVLPKPKLKAKPKALGRMEKSAEVPLEKHCDCVIRLLKSKGGSTRFAAVCPSSPIPRYVKRAFAENLQGKKFCTDLLRPFSNLSGRWAAERRWAQR